MIKLQNKNVRKTLLQPFLIKEILNELEESGAKTIILLGDLPTQETYGQRHDIVINNKIYSVIPLCHPRNAARLGAFSIKQAEFHDEWVRNKID